MPKLPQLELDRRAKTPLAEQICNGIRNAIETGVLASGARLPSWQDLAAQLGVARGIECSPSQVVVTGGFSSGLGLALRVLGLEGRKVWMEDPGFPFTRRGLELARLSLAPIPSIVRASMSNMACAMLRMRR